MSILAPHIRVLRAQADSLERAAAFELSDVGKTIMLALVKAKRGAADVLEAEERELTQRLDGAPSSVHYDPKGKPPRASER